MSSGRENDFGLSCTVDETVGLYGKLDVLTGLDDSGLKCRAVSGVLTTACLSVSDMRAESADLTGCSESPFSVARHGSLSVDRIRRIGSTKSEPTVLNELRRLPLKVVGCPFDMYWASVPLLCSDIGGELDILC